MFRNKVRDTKERQTPLLLLEKEMEQYAKELMGRCNLAQMKKKMYDIVS